MNSLFSSFGNLFATSLKTTQSTPNILLQALGAAMRGERPQDFMQNLAAQHPQLRQYDFTHLEQTAQQVCQQNGINMQDMINQIDNTLGTFVKK